MDPAQDRVAETLEAAARGAAQLTEGISGPGAAELLRRAVGALEAIEQGIDQLVAGLAPLTETATSTATIATNTGQIASNTTPATTTGA